MKHWIIFHRSINYELLSEFGKVFPVYIGINLVKQVLEKKVKKK